MFKFEIYFEGRADIILCFPISLMEYVVQRKSRMIPKFYPKDLSKNDAIEEMGKPKI